MIDYSSELCFPVDPKWDKNGKKKKKLISFNRVKKLKYSVWKELKQKKITPH